jgi:hypothetical protein
MIRIKFPRKPLSSQRKKAVELAKKLKYSEDEYDSMAESENIEDFKEIFDAIGNWQGVFTFVDDKEINFIHLSDIYTCVKNKIPFTNLKWYGLSKRRWDDQDFRDFPKKLNDFSDKNAFFMESELNDLMEMGIIEVVEYKKKYNVTKDKFKEKIEIISLLVKRIVPTFESSEVLKIIDNFPEILNVIPRKSMYDENLDEEEDLEDEEDEPEGEEWVDWCDKLKYDLKILSLLEKIEENTRK